MGSRNHHFALGLVVAWSVLAASSATSSALDPPHNQTATPPITCASCHALRDGSNPVARGAAQEALCKSCHNPTGQAAAMSDVASHDVGGGQAIDCGSCHDPHGPQQSSDPHPGGVTADNLSLIRADTAKYVPGALEPAVFQDRSTHFAFDGSSTPWNGICQSCHQNTAHHTNDASGDHDHAIVADCTACHQHGSGFQPTTGFDTCVACHAPGNTTGAVDPLTTNGSGAAGKHTRHVTELGFDCYECHDQYLSSASHANGTLDTQTAANIVIFDSTNPAGVWSVDSCSSLACHGSSTVQWYLDQPWTLPPCGDCHAAAVGARRPVVGAGGDFAANPAVASHHVAGSSDPTEGQCRVCHDQTLHMAGQVVLRDPDGGASVSYDPAAASSLEPFCLGCHDTDGATASFAGGGAPLGPFANGALLGTAPYTHADKIATSWAKQYGHGAAGRAPADRLTCAGNGEPGTGCHGSGGTVNAHGSANEGLAAKRYQYSASSRTYDEGWFTLCFDCHASYPGVTKQDVLGVLQGGRMDAGYGYMYRDPAEPALDRRKPPYYTPGLTTKFADHNEISASVGAGPKGILYADGDLWVVNVYDETVSRVDISTGQTITTIALGGGPGPAGGIAFDGSHVWITQNGDWNLAKINVSDNSMITVDVGDAYPHGVTTGNGYVWVTTRDRVVKIDATTNTINASIDFSGLRPEGIAFDGTYLWVAYRPNLLAKIDPTTNAVILSVTVGNSPYNVAVGAGHIWVTNTNDDTISKVDPTTNTEVAVIAVGSRPFGIVYDGTAIWAANATSANVSKVNVTTETEEATVALNGTGMGVAFDGRYVWAVAATDNSLAKIDPMTATMVDDPYGINDPPTHTSGTNQDMNLHWYHMRFFTNFRGTGLPQPPWDRGALCDNCHRPDANNVNATCVNCHNVHGSNTAYGALYDEMGYTHVSGAWGEYGKLPAEILLPATDPSYLDLDAFPTFCAYNCHNDAGSGLKLDLQGPRRAWFDPITE